MKLQSLQMLGSATIAGLLLLSGCSSDTPPAAETKVEKKKPAVPTGPITGLTAYYEMY
jgi:outer membrane murein-binding lipoprotein Lpp